MAGRLSGDMDEALCYMDDRDEAYEVLTAGRTGGYPLLLGLRRDERLPEWPEELPLLTGENCQLGGSALYEYWDEPELYGMLVKPADEPSSPGEIGWREWGEWL